MFCTPLFAVDLVVFGHVRSLSDRTLLALRVKVLVDIFLLSLLLGHNSLLWSLFALLDLIHPVQNALVFLKLLRSLRFRCRVLWSSLRRCLHIAGLLHGLEKLQGLVVPDSELIELGLQRFSLVLSLLISSNLSGSKLHVCLAGIFNLF